MHKQMVFKILEFLCIKHSKLLKLNRIDHSIHCISCTFIGRHDHANYALGVLKLLSYIWENGICVVAQNKKEAPKVTQ